MKQDFHVDTAYGPASGIVGRADEQAAKKRPLLVALHGGTYTSAYFDVPGYSFIDRATAAGFDILALDRPGYRQTAQLEDGELMLDRNATRISALLPEVAAALDLDMDAVVLVGHSMGGVIASTIAARLPSWPLKGIAGTGFAHRLPAHLAEAFAGLPRQYYIELPTPMKDQLMFGPPDTLAEGMPAQSHIANTHMPRAEAIDIVEWGTRAAGILGQIQVPVYYKLAEFEQLWNTSEQPAVAAMHGKAPSVLSGILPGVGHCIDFHKLGAGFQDEVLQFAASL